VQPGPQFQQELVVLVVVGTELQLRRGAADDFQTLPSGNRDEGVVHIE